MEDWTLWEIVAYIDGRNEAYSRDDKLPPMSNEEFDELLMIHNVPTRSAN